MIRNLSLVAAAIVIALLARPAVATEANWIGTWTASPVPPGETISQTGFRAQTLRMRVHTSLGGRAIRLHFSNLFGDRPLQIARVTVAKSVALSSARIDAASVRAVTFSNDAHARIPSGASLVSDAVPMPLEPGTDLVVSMYVAQPTGRATYHELAFDTTFIAPGDRTTDAGRAFAVLAKSFYFLTAVDVLNSDARGAIVAFGDSITDGVRSTIGLHRRWPDRLAARLRRANRNGYGVLDAGIGGNRILLDGDYSYGPSALRRFGRDALSLAGVRAVILFEGVNDILEDPHQLDAAKIIAGLRGLIAQAHAAHIRIFASPIGPCQTWTQHMEAQERTRERVNAWIRTGGAFDGVFDFDRVLTDPKNRPVMRKRYDSGDHLHPNDAGFAAIGDSIDLTSLQR